MPENNDNDSRTETSDGASPRGLFTPKLDRLGVFRIEKELSSGGGGTVYLAFDESMKRRVALKVLHPSLSITPKAQERFAREAWIAGQLEHANIIRVHSRGEENQLNYIAMEYAEGGSLSDYIKQLQDEASRTKDITVTANREHIKSIVAKFVDLANALEYIHSKGFIHRDIKPHNILLAGTTKQFKLTDFGIAHAENMTRMTKAGDFFGTIHYMSPEQITAHRTTVDKRTDIYSLGVTLYEALTLSLPFEGGSEEKLIGEIISGHYIPARKRVRHIPKDLETILMQATHHDPSRRYQSAKEFTEDLNRFSDNRAIAARRDSIFYKVHKNLSLKRRSNQVALILILFLSLSGIVLTKVQQDRFDNEKILTTLKQAVATKTSPFEFEPDWPRLSKKLFNHVKEEKLDSSMIWFLKTTAMPYYEFQKYMILEKAGVRVGIDGLKIFDSSSSAASQFIAHISQIGSFAGNTDRIHNYSFYYYEYQNPNSHIMYTIGIKDDVYINQTGNIIIPLRVITEHYLNTAFFEKTELSKGDTVKADFLGRSGPSKVWATLDKDNLIPTVPIFVDTVLDSVEIWAFDKWPDDFPKSTLDSNLQTNFSNIFNITKFQVIKTDRVKQSSQFEIKISGILGGSGLTIPVAGHFTLSDGGRPNFVAGQILAEKGSFEIDLPTTWGPINSSGIESASIENDPNVFHIFARSFTFDNAGKELQDFYDTLSGLGEIDAVFTIVPSLEIARDYGNINKFWGETLIFKIKLQAIDSAGLELPQQDRIVQGRRMVTVFTDSTFLIKQN